MPIRLESTFKGHSEKAKDAYLNWKKSLKDGNKPKYHYAGMCIEHIIYALVVNIYNIKDFSPSSYYEIQTKNPNYHLRQLGFNESFGVSICVHLLKLKGILKKEFHMPLDIIKKNRNDDVHHLATFFESDLKYTNNWLDNFVSWFTKDIAGEPNWENEVLLDGKAPKKAEPEKKIEIISPLGNLYSIEPVVTNKDEERKIKRRDNVIFWWIIIGCTILTFIICIIQYLWDKNSYEKQNSQTRLTSSIVDTIGKNKSVTKQFITTSSTDPNVQTYLKEADKLYNDGKYKEAIKKYDIAIRLNPNEASSYGSRGYAKMSVEDYNGALVDYSRAIQLDPSSDSYYYNRGGAEYGLKENDSAILDFSRAIRLDPKGEWSYWMRGAVKYRIKDYHGALDDYNEAIKLNPKEAHVYEMRGWAEEKLNDYAKACSDFEDSYNLGYKEAKNSYDSCVKLHHLVNNGRNY